MMRHGFWVLSVIFVLACKNQPKPKSLESLTSYVNPFIGTDGPGNTYPGATVPFGMVQLSPDIGIPGWDRIAGYYYPDSILTGFSHTHLTGTGAGDLYDILVMPTNSRFKDTLKANNYKPYSHFNHVEEGASPGYYWVQLKDYGIKAELTATPRVGIHKYTFPRDTLSQIHVDLGYSLNWDRPTNTKITVVNDSVLQGFRMSEGWARNQQLYFEMTFSKPFSSYYIKENKEGQATKIILNYQTEEDEVITVKTGLSSASVGGASKAIKEEAKQDFESIRKQTNAVWEKELSKIRITTQNKERKTIFYTMMYQSMLAPTLYSDSNQQYKAANDANGQYLPETDSIAMAKGFNRYDTFSLWDTYRAAHPLYTIIQTERVPDIIKSLLAHYQETGKLPVWSMQGSETNMMIGYHAVPVIVDAYFKGFEFDANLAYQSCKTSAMVKERQIDEFAQNGYIATAAGHENWSVSKTLEYAYDDWCLAQFAKDLGKEEDFDYFLERSNNWKNVYNAKNSWLQPKDASGTFIYPFTPKEYSPYFCESNAWQYYWSVAQDIPGLVAATGGANRFEQKLDSMFTYAPLPTDKLPIFSTGMIGQYAHGNEPSHHVAYLYNYIGKPHKTQDLVYKIRNEQYKNEPNGHCGNEDCGQMSSWYILNSLGMYPVNAAQGILDLSVPQFSKASIQLPNNKTFEVKATGLSEENRYVAAVSLNGRQLKRRFITYKELMKGGILEFIMTANKDTVNTQSYEQPNPLKIYN